MDTVSASVRSKIMQQVKSKNTKPELAVRSLLHRMGFRFRLHDPKLPGRPDIVLKRHKTVIFVHGCFWHRHKGCKRMTMPASNQDYWKRKFDRNLARDRVDKRKLRRLGWRVIVVWECETKNVELLAQRFLSCFVTNHCSHQGNSL
jgi:DNA mismatch endonuclease (patch repair protein)